MPTYDYVCDACEHAFEEFQSITAKPLKKCPSCAKPKLRRLIGTGAGVLFKGGGFYETDYRSEGYKNAAKADKPSDGKTASESKPETKSETKSDSKPAAESKPKPAESKPTKAAAKKD